MNKLPVSTLALSFLLMLGQGCSSSQSSASDNAPDASSPAPERCGIWGHPCCEGSQCGPGLQCQVDRCVQGRHSSYAQGCTEDAECPGGVCSYHTCSITCESDSQCPPNNTCTKQGHDSAKTCVCEILGADDRCDNQDNDCDGIVDNQVEADSDCKRSHGFDFGYVCRQGQCVCPGTCDGKCTDLPNDPKNCGACGKTCGEKEFCNGGDCESLLSKMIQIPGGTFQMGADDLDDASPVHSVTVSSFWLDETEVTVQAFLACIKDGVCSRHPVVTGCFDEFTPHNPINCVPWEQAKAFCEWAGKKLPTEAQWEYAAKHGSDNWRYPWGNQEPTSDKLCWKGGLWACEVGGHGAYGFGLRDMAGNVAEWIAESFAPYSSEPQTDPFLNQDTTASRYPIIRGGGYWEEESKGVRTASRSSGWNATQTTGIRCAK